MKTVYLVRHAKSSWDYPELEDHERPLNERGLRDAPMMAGIMRKKGVEPDVLISSPAVRAMTTALFFKSRLGLEGEDILVRDQIYEAAPVQILSLINMLPEDYNVVMLFGHNPTFTSVANLFSDDYISNIPTCGIVKIEADVKNWMEFSEKSGHLKTFDYPKLYL